MLRTSSTVLVDAMSIEPIMEHLPEISLARTIDRKCVGLTEGTCTQGVGYDLEIRCIMVTCPNLPHKKSSSFQFTFAQPMKEPAPLIFECTYSSLRFNLEIHKTPNSASMNSEFSLNGTFYL